MADLPGTPVVCNSPEAIDEHQAAEVVIGKVSMVYFLTVGTVLGLSAGLAPGPLLTLVISETLQHDIKSGIRIAMAPLITDLPIILLSLFVLSKLSDFNHLLGIISLAGGCFILNMSFKNFRTRGMEPGACERHPNRWQKGCWQMP